MAEFRIDRLKFNWKGDWHTSKPYRKDDVVYYGGNTYVCLQGHTSSGNNFYNDVTPDSVTTTFVVTTGVDSINGTAHGVLYINGEENPELNLIKGRTYIFNQDDISNKTYNDEIHPLLISNVVDGTSAGGYAYEVNVKYYIDNAEVADRTTYLSQFTNSNFRKIEITIPDTAPKKLFYFSTLNTGMGNEINVRYSSYWEIMFDGFAWKADWTKTTRYNIDDLVKYNGYVYKCLTEHVSTSDTNEDFINDKNNWEIYSTGYNWRNLWTTETIYYRGDIVRYNGIIYECVTDHQSAVDVQLGLENDAGNWNIVSRSDNWTIDWATDIRYKNDDLVKYGGNIYRCTSGHTSANSDTDGLEINNADWDVVVNGIEYKGDFQAGFRYKVGDIVRNGHSLWKANTGHTSGTSLRANESNWNIYVLGLGYEEIWDELLEYKAGDIVLYGGYAYTALDNNIGNVPSVQGIAQDAGPWELLTAGYKMQGDWNAAQAYKTGDVVRVGGYLYIATGDNSAAHPDLGGPWQLLVPQDRYRAEWLDDAEYELGDVVLYKGTTYICIARHTSTSSGSRPDLDQDYTQEDFWQILLQGTPSNVLVNPGDLKTHDGTSTTNLAIGTPGNVLKTSNNTLSWGNYELVPNAYYVSTEGLDEPTAGETLASPFRSVKYACEYIAQDLENRAPATIFIKTGLYQEDLPIKVPRDVALVGDELRSTVIVPATGFESSDMFYVNNGCGIRNMTLQGLNGTLGEANDFLTKRPSAGAFVSLDPGTGASDSLVWIINKSPYIQNVSTFGTGCIGMKVDGSLHNGGNKSIVANDFTQIVSDGIGYWATNGGRSELVSVFTYYAHIGYLATDGGILRATNGNNSYGDYGSVAEGFDQSETPVNGAVNNRDNEAQVEEIFTYGTASQEILALGYSFCGQDYSTASATFNGSGFGAVGSFDEFRNGAVSSIRMIDPGDSSIPGGFDYQFVSNSAQEGTSESITLAAADVGTAAKYIGMRIVIKSGKGVGQYAQITGFDDLTKIVTPSRESDGSLGWEHFLPGWPIESTLDETTVYTIEPKVTAEEPTYTASTYTAGSVTGNTYEYIVSDNDQKILVVPSDLGETHAYSTNAGTTWTNSGSPLRVGATSTGAVWTGQEFIITTDSTYRYTSQSSSPAGWTEGTGAPANYTGVASDGAGNVVLPLANGSAQYSSDHGSSYLTATAIAGLPAYGNGKFIIINDNGNVAYSTDNGATWTTTTSAVSATAWNEVIYGNGRFVAISASGNLVARSFDGIDWFETTIETDQTLNRVSYGAGTFIATGGTTSVALSTGTDVWRTVDDGSTAFTTTGTGTWTGSVYYNNSWILLNSGSNNWNTISTGTRPVVRATVSSSRISSLLIYDPGSNYSSAPAISIIDPENTVDAVYDINLNNGVLPQPTMSNRGAGYVTASATISGNGFADIYQVGKTLKLTNVSAVPGVGANLTIAGIDEARYSVSVINDITGTGPYSMTLTITPSLGVAEAPAHDTAIIIREKYSQIRLTGHDFLDIGTGNQNSTRYPNLYIEGETSENEPKPFNETVASGGGRVFYTSTDQDGNFRVGELFQVEQARGVVTISASQFDLTGLEELSLGGIQVGGSAVVIREFSKDDTFIANSDNIVPTEQAIKAYVTSRISGGSSNAATNTLIAGQIQITQNNISSNSGLPIQITPVVNLTKGYTGVLLALQYFSFGVNTQFDEFN